MTFHMPKKEIQNLTLKIDGVNIEKVEEFNFLGLTMDTKWKKNIDKISNKCSKTTGVLNRLKHVFPQEIKCLLYNSLILPHINYCITAWGFNINKFRLDCRACVYACVCVYVILCVSCHSCQH